MEPLEVRLKRQAHALGFELAGIAPAAPADGFERLRDWLSRGFAGEMDYLPRHADARRHPAAVLPAVRSVVMVGMNYRAERGAGPREKTGAGAGAEALGHVPAPAPDAFSRATGRVARYARGADYHD